MPEVLDWQGGAPQERSAHAADLLAQGRLVAVPTDSVYVVLADARQPDALARLPSGPDGLTILVPGVSGLRAWVPEPPPLALRFARRCWPGPLTLVLDATPDRGPAAQLPEAARARLFADGTVALYAPAHEAPLLLLQALPFPLAAATPRLDGQPVTTAAQALAVLGDAAALVLDDGPTQFGQAPTRVRVRGDRWEIVGDGVLSEAVLQQVAPCLILFVCTGNTCRSPLAEALCRRLLAERLGCAVQELPRRGYVITSAGLATGGGEPATSEAVEVAREHGADLSQHQSQPLSLELLAAADHVIAMTRGHLRALTAHTTDGGGTLRLLMADGSDVADPIGGPGEVYRACAEQIRRALVEWLPQMG